MKRQMTQQSFSSQNLIAVIAKSYRNIFLDLTQACDKRAMETPHLLVAAVRAVSVVVVL